jgi:hypothetical protein
MHDIPSVSCMISCRVVRLVTGEFEGAEALAGVKILQHVQEELVEQAVLLYGDEEGQVYVIFGSDAVRHVVLQVLEVEQAACTKGKMTMELESIVLKPACLNVLPGQADVVCADDGQLAKQEWLEYPFCKSHPIIHWLPSKLAAWIGENYGQELLIPPKLDVEWTAGELNAILENNLVPSHGGKGQLRTFGCIQWECELYSGRRKARCYPFNLKGHRFRGRNRQVFYVI